MPHIEGEAGDPNLPRLYTVDEAIERIRVLTKCTELPLGRRRFAELARCKGCYRVWRKIYVTDEQIVRIVEALHFRDGSYNLRSSKPRVSISGDRSAEAIKLHQELMRKKKK